MDELIPELYFVCTWATCYPSGGLGNIVLVTNSLDVAEDKMKEIRADKHFTDNLRIYRSCELDWVMVGM